MSRAHRVGVIAGSGMGVKTYAEFVAHITSLAVNGSRDWLSTAGWPVPSAILTTASASSSGDMIGSCWSSSFRGGSTGGTTITCRMVQHGFPSEAAFNDQVASGRDIFMRIDNGSAPSGYASLNRNGYTSLSSASTVQARICTEIIYWDGERAQKMQPSLGLGPTPYTW